MSLIRLFWAICIFRKGPQDVPASSTLLGVVVLVYLVAGILMLGMETHWQESLLRVWVEGLLLGGCIWGVLTATGHRARFLQTAAAVYACDTLISVLAAVPVLILMAGFSEPEPIRRLMIILMLWHWSILGHILRHALSIRWALGMLLALAYIVFSYSLLAQIFPPHIPSPPGGGLQ